MSLSILLIITFYLYWQPNQNTLFDVEAKTKTLGRGVSGYMILFCDPAASVWKMKYPREGKE